MNIAHKPTEQAAEDTDTRKSIGSYVNDNSHIVRDDYLQDDSRNKDYLTEEEAFSFEPLTDVRNVVSMRQSILRMIGNGH